MLIYFEDLKPEIQTELVDELVARLGREEGDDAPELLPEKAAHIIDARNWGVEMDF